MTGSNNPMITDKWVKRLELMRLLTHLNASARLHYAVESILKESNDKERTADDILSIIREVIE